MKVQDNKSKPALFDDIGIGECFLFSGNTYIKTLKVSVRDITIAATNAVRLNDGVHGNFQSDTSVKPLPDAVVITRRTAIRS